MSGSTFSAPVVLGTTRSPNRRWSSTMRSSRMMPRWNALSSTTRRSTKLDSVDQRWHSSSMASKIWLYLDRPTSRRVWSASRRAGCVVGRGEVGGGGEHLEGVGVQGGGEDGVDGADGGVEGDEEGDGEGLAELLVAGQGVGEDGTSRVFELVDGGGVEGLGGGGFGVL